MWFSFQDSRLHQCPLITLYGGIGKFVNDTLNDSSIFNQSASNSCCFWSRCALMYCLIRWMMSFFSSAVMQASKST